MGWGHACWHASAYVLVIMTLLCHACGCGFEQQKVLCASPIELKSSEFRSFTVCLLLRAVIMVIKKHTACLQEFLQNYKLGYYSVTRPLPPLRRGSNARLGVSHQAYHNQLLKC